MKKTEAYKCDYCAKIYKRSSDCMKHEKICKKNPDNKHSCFNFCKHLIKETNYSEDGEYTTCEFSCEILKKQMYSYKLESPWRYGKTRIKSIKNSGGFRMPLKCNKYICKDLYNYRLRSECEPEPCSYCPKYGECDETKTI